MAGCSASGVGSIARKASSGVDKGRESEMPDRVRVGLGSGGDDKSGSARRSPSSLPTPTGFDFSHR